jgi:hypothetical protein
MCDIKDVRRSSNDFLSGFAEALPAWLELPR